MSLWPLDLFFTLFAKVEAPVEEDPRTGFYKMRGRISLIWALFILSPRAASLDAPMFCKPMSPKMFGRICHLYKVQFKPL